MIESPFSPIHGIIATGVLALYVGAVALVASAVSVGNLTLGPLTVPLGILITLLVFWIVADYLEVASRD